MKQYRIFSRDRGRKYSALMPGAGVSAADAIQNARGIDDLKRIPGMLEAIEWPPTIDGLYWLSKNV